MTSHVNDSTQPVLTLRPATPDDQKAIVALVTRERLNPTGLHWSRFTLAMMNGSLVGAVQMRWHRDGSRELGSLVVAGPERGQGIAARLIDSVLAGTTGPVHVITGRPHARRWAGWGFAPIAPQKAPRSVRFNYRMGRMGRVLSFLRGQPPRQLLILERPAIVKTNACRIRAGAQQEDCCAHASGQCEEFRP
jgi:amino-acid N-acetyltransferase